MLRITILSASIAWFAVADTHEQSGCTSQIVDTIATALGLPTTWVQLIPFALRTESTAEPPYDQVTQTSPTFANRDEESLKREDSDLAKAQQSVRSMPLSPGNQTCISNMQKVRDNILKELNLREFEHIPP